MDPSNIVPSHCNFHSVHIFLLGPYVANNAEVCDISTLGDFVPVDEKNVLVPLVLPMPCKKFTILLDLLFLHFSLSGPFMEYHYSCAFPVLWQMTSLIMPDWRVRFPFAWSITAHSSPAGIMMVAVLLGAEVGVLIVATCFSMWHCTWIQYVHVLYLCICGTVVLPFEFLVLWRVHWFHFMWYDVCCALGWSPW